MNDSIFTKMMLSLQESKKEETKANLKALKESKEALNEEAEIEVAEQDIEAPIDEVETVDEVTECEEKETEGTEVTEEVKTEDISQDSQIKTTNKGTEVKKIDGIKPATGKDGVPDKAVNDKKLDGENPDADPATDANIASAVKKTKLEDADLSIKTGGRLIEITDAEDACAECEPAEDLAVTEPEVVEEPVEDVVEEEEEFIDESTFNPFLAKFIKDNYSNAKSVKVESARMNRKELVLECALTFNSGKTSKFDLGLRGIVKEGRINSLRAYDKGFFKAESVKAPLTFKVSYKNNTIKCEGLEYNFKAKLTEGKTREIKGKLIIK